MRQKTGKEKFYRSAYIMYLDKDKKMLLYLLSTGRIDTNLEWDLCFNYIGARSMSEAIELLSSNKDYLVDYSDSDIEKWTRDKKTKRVIAPKKAQSILVKIYECAKIEA